MVRHVEPLLLAGHDLLARERFLGGLLRELGAPVEAVPVRAGREGTGGRTDRDRVGILARLAVQRDRVGGVGVGRGRRGGHRGRPVGRHLEFRWNGEFVVKSEAGEEKENLH